METLESARQLLREYGDRAEEECEARAGYHEMQGNLEAANKWRALKQMVALLRGT